MLDIASLNYAELKAAREQINDRLRQLEHAAVATLQHRPLQFGFRLIKAAFGFKYEPAAQATEPENKAA